MCGILGYFGRQLINLSSFFKVMADLETAKINTDKSPVGGHGAGIAILDEPINIEKVGKENGSPVNALREKITDCEVTRILGHVRHASSAFKDTVIYKQCTQPYCIISSSEYNLVSVHNGLFKNYNEVIAEMGSKYKFESEEIRLIDSEIIPYYFLSLLTQENSIDQSANMLYDKLCGNGNAIALWVKKDTVQKLIILYKGKVRGLYIWKNKACGVFFSSRREPVEKHFNKFLMNNGYKLVTEIAPQTDGSHKQTFVLQ
jgi:glucosamine 6-phosphate synthetase-like amidotransferase/phosphosugar isomerase protein